MSDAEQIMSLVWGRIIDDVRKMRDDKYTLERIGSILGVAKPTVQRWLENNAGGEKTAFIDILRYLKALDINLKQLLYGEEDNARGAESAKVLDGARADNQRMAMDLLEAQKELLQAQHKIIELQEKVLNLEKFNVEITDKARRAIIAAAQGKKAVGGASAAAPAAAAGSGKRRLDPSQFPDLPPIHLKQGK